MNDKNKKNMGASILAQIKNLSKELKIDTQTLLRRYAQERLLYRMSISEQAKNFCLKGGVLLSIYNNNDLRRPTDDIDFSGNIPNGTVDSIKNAILDIINTDVEDDGIVFFQDTIKTVKDHTGIISGGKLFIEARVHTAKIDVRVDVGFNNIITPNAIVMEMPTLLSSIVPKPTIMTYPLETVIAEKFHAMAQFGDENTRIKDYYDIWKIINLYSFEGYVVANAIKNTFEKQQRNIPDIPSYGISEKFAQQNISQWNGFMKKIGEQNNLDFINIMNEIIYFLKPIVNNLKNNTDIFLWDPNEKWTDTQILRLK